MNQSWFHYSRAPSLIDAERWPHVFYDPSCVGKLFKRSFLFDNNLFFPQSFHEDQAFCFKLFSLNEKMAVSNKIVYFYVARSSEQVSSGTQIFSTEKFRQILLAGTLASETLLRSTLNPSTKNHALGLLVLRYDRFLYKRAQAEKKSGSKSRSDEGAARNDDEALASSVALQLLQRLMVSIQDEVIVRHARYFPLVFLMTKRGKYDLAEEVYSGDSSNARAYLELSDERCLNSLDEVSETGRYDYFKAVPLAKAGGSVVTEMSYLYRLGALFVNAYKNPGEVWKTPAEAVTLAFDVVTGIGRKKQKAAEQERLESSIEALRNHSDFITATTAYQLGLALKEAITQGPAKIRRLPSRIKAIYLSSAGKRA